MKRCIALLPTLLACAAAAAPSLPAGRYALESRVTMPHLEEMRRQVDVQTRCLGDDDLRGFFPVMHQPALNGCEFGYPEATADGMRFVLVCESARVATGTAEVRARGETYIGDLRIKMGGKNMTFAQRVEARRLADCDVASAQTP